MNAVYKVQFSTAAKRGPFETRQRCEQNIEMSGWLYTGCLWGGKWISALIKILNKFIGAVVGIPDIGIIT